jgi:pimeloyl-ACP methyl ester carboxylesterase
MPTTSLLLALALAVSATVAGDMQARRTDPRRPVILVVHGRGFLSRDSAVFRRDALQALRAGAFRATGDSLLEDDDLRLVWYADLMDVRRREARSLTSCDNGAGTSEEGSSAGFFLRPLAQVVSELVEGGAADSSDDGARDIAGDLRFIGDRTVRCGAQARVADALARARAEGRPVVIVAHSLGALVTWGYLEHRGDRDVPEIERLVTVGAPIGNDGLRELLMGDTAKVSLPRGVRSWINAVNIDDGLAARIVSSDVETPGITDIVTGRTEESAHDLRGYLRDSSTAKAVVGAWCAAAKMKGRLAGCVAIEVAH